MTYVMSDIHGEYKKYVRMLESIGFHETDTLYVLGDVVDRGPEPIRILLDMMNRPNVFPLMGNHDLGALAVLEQYSSEAPGGLFSDDFVQVLEEWCKDGGESTIKGFFALSKEQQNDVIDYLKEFSLLEVAETDCRTFVLVHAGLGNYRPGKKLREYTDEELLFCRPDPAEQYFDDESVYVVMGHTPTPYFSGKPEIYKNGRNIFIDCGACSPKGRLACLCLETMEEFYV
ncbi:MAG: metallophosphoesterase [Oscillospiraceae bacterium]